MGVFANRLSRTPMPVTTISVPCEYLHDDWTSGSPVVSISMLLRSLDDENIVRSIVVIDGIRCSSHKRKAWWLAIGPRARMFVRLCLKEMK